MKNNQPIGYPTSAPIPSDLLFSPDGKTLALTTWDSTNDKLRSILVDVATQQIIVQFSTSSIYTFVSSKAFSPYGKPFVIGSSNGTILFWNITKQEIIGQISTSSTIPTNLTLSADGKAFMGSVNGNYITAEVEKEDPFYG